MRATLASLLRRMTSGVFLSGAAVVAARFGVFQKLLGMPPTIEVAFAILLVAAILWITEAVPLFVTSLIVLQLEISWLAPALGKDGTVAPPSVFLSPFFSDVTLLFLGGFVLSSVLQKGGLDRALAHAVMRRTGGNPQRVQLALLGTTALLSMWMSNTASAALMLAIAQSVTAHLPAQDGFRKSLFVGVPFAANLGGLGTPIGTPPNAIALQYMQQAGVSPGFGTWMLLALPFVVLLLIGTYFLLRRVYPSKLVHVAFEGTPNGTAPHGGAPDSSAADNGASFSPGRTRFVLTVIALTVGGWVTGDVHGLSSGVVALLPVILFFGSGVLAVKDLRALPWDVILLIGGGLSLGDAVERGGLARWIVDHVPTEGLSMAVLIAVIAATAASMTAVMSNTAAANLLLPVAATLAPKGNMTLLLAVAFACSLSMPLPVSTPPNAMAFATGAVTSKDILRPGVIVTLASLLLIVVLGPPLWSAVLGDH